MFFWFSRHWKKHIPIGSVRRSSGREMFALGNIVLWLLIEGAPSTWCLKPLFREWAEESAYPKALLSVMVWLWHSGDSKEHMPTEVFHWISIYWESTSGATWYPCRHRRSLWAGCGSMIRVTHMICSGKPTYIKTVGLLCIRRARWFPNPDVLRRQRGLIQQNQMFLGRGEMMHQRSRCSWWRRKEGVGTSNSTPISFDSREISSLQYLVH